MLREQNPNATASVREGTYTMLPSGLCSADSVAARLGIDRRTVHRHLAREGKTFSAIKGSVRAGAQIVSSRGQASRSIASVKPLAALAGAGPSSGRIRDRSCERA